ncbi:hypothetical protein FRC11_011102, partial [Ceratobasidium sp. 423]
MALPPQVIHVQPQEGASPSQPSGSTTQVIVEQPASTRPCSRSHSASPRTHIIQ